MPPPPALRSPSAGAAWRGTQWEGPARSRRTCSPPAAPTGRCWHRGAAFGTRGRDRPSPGGGAAGRPPAAQARVGSPGGGGGSPEAPRGPGSAACTCRSSLSLGPRPAPPYTRGTVTPRCRGTAGAGAREAAPGGPRAGQGQWGDAGGAGGQAQRAAQTAGVALPSGPPSRPGGAPGASETRRPDDLRRRRARPPAGAPRRQVGHRVRSGATPGLCAQWGRVGPRRTCRPSREHGAEGTRPAHTATYWSQGGTCGRRLADAKRQGREAEERCPGAGGGAGGSERAAAGPSVRGGAACAPERADMSGVHLVARELLHAGRWRPMPSARRRASDFPPFLVGEGRANGDAVTSSGLRVTACAVGRGGGVAFIRSGASSPAAQSSGAAGPARRTAVHPRAPLCAPTPFRQRSPRSVSPQPEPSREHGAEGTRPAHTATYWSQGGTCGRRLADAKRQGREAEERCPGAGGGAGGSERAAAGPSVRGGAACAPERADMSGVHVVAPRAPAVRAAQSQRLPASGFSGGRGPGGANGDGVTSSGLRVTTCTAGRGGVVSLGYGAGRHRPLRRAREQPAQRAARRCTPGLLSAPRRRFGSAARARGQCLSVHSLMFPRPRPHVPAARRPTVRSPGSPQPEARGSAARRPTARSPGSPQPEARGSAARRPTVRRRAAAGPQPEAPRRAPPRPRTRLRGSRGGRAARPRSCRSRSARAGLAFSVCQVERLLRAGRYANRLGASAPIFLAAVIQFLTATVLGLAGDEARHRRSAYITPELVDRALHNHELLSGLFTMTTVSQVAPARY
nr:spidroin-2-like [Nyctereutes procyonoides]